MISGVVASIVYAYYRAAAIEGYTVTRDKQTKAWTVSGRIVLADAYKLSQGPLYFVAPYAGGEWRWRILDPVRRDVGPFVARLGPLESRKDLPREPCTTS